MDERTVEILKRFSSSWSDTLNFYDDLIDNYPGFEKLKPVRQFIADLRMQGEDKHFRLGTSLHTLVISRSVDHGLRHDQKRLKVETIKCDDFEITLRDGEKIYRQYRIMTLGDIKLTKLIKTLKGTLVD